MQKLKLLYSKLRTLPVVGTVITLFVRAIKRILGLPTARAVDRVDVLTSGLTGMRTRLDHQARIIAELRSELEAQKLMVDLLVTAQEARGLSVRSNSSKPPTQH